MNNKPKQKEVINPSALAETYVDRFVNSAIIGLWRMGNSDAVIANVLNVTHKHVFSHIKLYSNIIKDKTK